MCGIAGAVAALSERSADNSTVRHSRRACVERVSAALQHRGPDGDGLWGTEAGDVVFAHRRLAILDLSNAGAQPMVDAESGCVITFNGEIYNFRVLRRELESLGERFHSTSDTEVVLKAYKHWGVDAVARLRGIFAIAIWDPRSRVVHLVRDQLGIKPLYWTVASDTSLGRETILFSSELRALLESNVVDRRLDPAGVASFLSQGFVVGPRTIIEGINLLPAATILTIASGEKEGDANLLELRNYWSPPSSPVRRTTEAELREVLADTVQMQLVSDAPLGIFLSGGIDSSAVAALASKRAAGQVHTFTIGFDDMELDESYFAGQVAEALGTHHTCVTLREDDFLSGLPNALDAIDQPTFDGINTYFVSRAAQGAGMKVALAGTGGDEMFGGYPSFREVPRLLRTTSWMPPRVLDDFIRGASRAAGGLFWNLLQQSPPQTRWGKVADVAHAAQDLLGLYQVYYSMFTQETQMRLASEQVRAAQGTQVFGLPPDVASTWRDRIDGAEERHAVSLLELASFLGERLLRDTDAASMAAGLEVRVPLLDHVLCETIAGIDPERRFSPLGKKQLLRDLALADLDPALFDRPKSGFVLPIDQWARRGLKPEMDRLLLDNDAVVQAGMRPDAVQTLWSSYGKGKPGLYWSRVWTVYVLVAWCQRNGVHLAS